MEKTIFKLLTLILIALATKTHAQLRWDSQTQSSSANTFENNFDDFENGTAPAGGCNGRGADVGSMFDSSLGRNIKTVNKPSGTSRAELDGTGSFLHNRTSSRNTYYSWRWAIDVDGTLASGDEVTVFQWKSRSSNSSQNYPINMEYRNGALTLNYFPPCSSSTSWQNCTKINSRNEVVMAFPSDRRRILKSIPLAENTWVEIVLRIERSPTSDANGNGKVQLWINGNLETLNGPNGSGQSITLKIDDGSPRTITDTSVRPKWGIYNLASCNYNITTFYDRLKAYDNNTSAVNNLSGSRPSNTSNNNNTSSNWPEVSPGKYIWASGYFQNNWTYAPGKANDGNFNTRWASEQNGSNTFIAYDLYQHYYVKKIKVNFDNAYANLRVWANNGNGWYWVKDVTTQYYSQEIPIDQTVRWISIQSLGGGPYDHVSIKEFDVFGNYQYGKQSNNKVVEIEGPPATLSSSIDIEEKSVKVFPNPVTDAFSIKLEGMAKAEVQITDLLGKTVYRTTTEDKTININKGTTFTSGLYIIKVTDSQNKTFINKLVVK